MVIWKRGEKKGTEGLFLNLPVPFFFCSIQKLVGISVFQGIVFEPEDIQNGFVPCYQFVAGRGLLFFFQIRQ